MVRTRVDVRSSLLAIVGLLTITGLTACSHTTGHDSSGLSAVGSGAPVVSPGSGPGSTTPPTSTSSRSTPGGAGATTKTPHPSSKSSPKPAPSKSAAPDDTDYSVAWSNADCHWFVDSHGVASVYAAESISANVLHQTGSVKSTVTSNGGGVPTGSENVPARLLKPGTYPFGFQISAPAADVAAHSITFTAKLTFDGVPDQLDTDNSSSLLIHFPVLFVPGSDGDENLTCDHVR